MKDFTKEEAKEYEQSLNKLYKPLNCDKYYADTAHQPVEKDVQEAEQELSDLDEYFLYADDYNGENDDDIS